MKQGSTRGIISVGAAERMQMTRLLTVVLAGLLTASWEPKAGESEHGGALRQVAIVALPQGTPGIGFDDLRFSAALGKVLVPAGRSGRLDLIDPASLEVHEIAGFSTQATYAGGHDDSVTSADAGAGFVYAIDRTKGRLAVVDPAAGTILRSVALAGHPDYVRYVESTREVWVSEPDAEQIEIFALGKDGRQPQHAAAIAVPGGPEALVVDVGRSRVYTQLWHGVTVAVDIHSRAIVARWENGCRSSRGLALDAERGFVIAACSEGKAVVMDLHDGHRVSDVETGGGVDIIDYDPHTKHVYVPSGATAEMAVAALSAEGHLTMLGSVPSARGAHCVVADRRGNAYVCDPSHGRLLVVHDDLVGPGG